MRESCLKLAPWILCAWLLFAPWPAKAGETGETHPQLRGFYPTGEFDLMIGESKTDAEILLSRRAAAYLILLPGKAQMFLLTQRDRSVATVSAQVVRHENGDVDLPLDAVAQRAGRFELEGTNILIDSPTLRARLVPRPPVLGRHTADAVLAHSPQYGLVMRAYRPDPTVLGRLKGSTGVTVEILFGSWCPRCQQSVGNALRVERDLEGGGIVFTYHGLPAPPAAWKDARFIETQTKALPTALVFVGDRAVGRVVPADWKQFEIELARILKR